MSLDQDHPVWQVLLDYPTLLSGNSRQDAVWKVLMSNILGASKGLGT